MGCGVQLSVFLQAIRSTNAIAAATHGFRLTHAAPASSEVSVHQRQSRARGWKPTSLVYADRPRGRLVAEDTVPCALSTVAAAFAHDGLAAKAEKQFDEAAFALVPVVEGCQNDFKIVLAVV
jgi:hypothetical protein